jgi:hypothetical protein
MEGLGMVEDAYEHDAMPLRDDNPSDVDMLGFEDVADVVEAIILRTDLDPITVGVNAPWGGGKTTVLHLLKRRFDARPDTLCLLVSPWEYDNKTDPTAALIDEVLGALERELATSPTFAEKVKGLLHSLRRRVKFAKAVKLAATAAVTTTMPGFGTLIDLFDDEKAPDNDAPADPTLQGFRQQFAEVMDAQDTLRRVIVLVDDLDRSLPDTVVETLEAIKLFLSVKKMAFVVAADEENVASAIGRRLATTGQPITSRQYLEKIVQVPVRVPALSRETTEEYLALLMLADVEGVGEGALAKITASRPSATGRILERLGGPDAEAGRDRVELAERLTPLLHRHTVGNPRRLKRFLNAFWLRMSFAKARGVELEPDALAKLMLAEMYLPDLFGQLLSWLAAGTIADKIAEIEAGGAEYSVGVREWGELQPSLSGADLAKYLFLAASLRGETLEELALSPELREVATRLASTSEGTRAQAQRDATALDPAEQALLAQVLAVSLRHQTAPDAQKAIATSLSALAAAPGAASTAAEELGRIHHGAVTIAVPIALLTHGQPAEFVSLIEAWRDSPDATDKTRNACVEALGPH